MAQINFPEALADGQIFEADTGVIYTYQGTPPNGYWSATFQADGIDVLDTRYVKLNDGGIQQTMIRAGLKINDNSTGDTIILNGNGSAEFVGSGSFNDGKCVVGVSDNTAINAYGAFYAYRDAGNKLAYSAGQALDGSAETLRILANGDITTEGSATFAGAVWAAGYTDNSTNSHAIGAVVTDQYTTGFTVASTKSALNGNIGFETTTSDGNVGCAIQLDGNATFAGTVTADSFVVTGGGGGDGNPGGTGDLHVTGDLQVDGSAVFAGGAASINSSGRLQITRTDAPVFIAIDGSNLLENTFRVDSTGYAYYNGDIKIGGKIATNIETNVENISLNADGSADFKGQVSIESVTSIPLALKRPADGSECFRIRKYNSNAAAISMNNNGSATFAGTVTTEGVFGGFISGQVPLPASDSNWSVFSGKNYAGNKTFFVKGDGSASFSGTGTFSVPGNSNGLVVKQAGVSAEYITLYAAAGGGGQVYIKDSVGNSKIQLLGNNGSAMFTGTVEGNNIQAAYYTAIPSIAANSPIDNSGWKNWQGKAYDGSTTSTINADGSAEFTSFIISEEYFWSKNSQNPDIDDNTTAGLYLYNFDSASSGTRSDAAVVISPTSTNNGNTLRLNYDGSAKFGAWQGLGDGAGVSINPLGIVEMNRYIGEYALKVYATGSTALKAGIKGDGSAEFAGDVIIGKPGGTTPYVRVANSTGTLISASPGGADDIGYGLYSFITGDYVIELKGNGSASFAGSVTAPNLQINGASSNIQGQNFETDLNKINSACLTLCNSAGYQYTALNILAAAANESVMHVKGDGTSFFKGNITAGNVTFNIEPDDDSNYVTTTDAEGNETRVYNGPTLDVKDRLTKVDAALQALKAAVTANSTLDELKAAIISALTDV